MIYLLKLIFISIILFSTDEKQNQPKRLNKKKQPKKRRKISINVKMIKRILFMLIIIMLCLIIVYIVFKTGSLESTRYYYRFDNII